MNYGDLGFVLAGPGHSGSTWLGHALRAHPGIFVTHEINFLTWTDQFAALDGFFATRHSEDKILGEHSNTYFSWEGIPEKLSVLNPALKIVFLVRDPVRKTISNYMHDRRWGILPSYITLEISILPNYFERRYIIDSDYVLNLRRWLDWFPANQVYLFRSMADQPKRGQFSDLVHFLGGEPHSEPAVDVMNRNFVPMFPQLHRNATFGPEGAWRSVCRAFDSLNIRLGERYGPEPYKPRDVEAVKSRLGEGATLEPLIKIADEFSIAGRQWLSK
jgi:hypothetical protein